MLEVTNLTKTYKKEKAPAIKNITFSVNNGEVYGIVGKNGAGKSTIIKCILGIFPYQEGNIVLNGISKKENENAVKKQIGYVPDNHPVYETLTGREYVNFLADIYGVSQKEREERIEEYVKSFCLENAIDKQIKGYSYGMKQKICVIGALVHDPCMWILDEPFLGLDPKSVNMLKESIKHFTLNKNNMVLFTSHDMDTVIEICNRVCVIDKGEITNILDMSDKKDVLKLKELTV